jgi:hypothetical protein
VIALGDAALAKPYEGGMGLTMVDGGCYHEFRSAALSLLRAVFGESHPFYREFDTKITSNRPAIVKSGQGILRAARNEIEAGWLVSVKQLLAADIFADFLDMAEYLLQQGYKDAAAVLIGSVLEENLRQRATAASIALVIERDGREIPKKADALNSELAKSGAYGTLDQKNVTAWLDLRNKAAHGKYAEYTHEQVQLLAQAVAAFVTRR